MNKEHQTRRPPLQHEQLINPLGNIQAKRPMPNERTDTVGGGSLVAMQDRNH